MERVNSEVVTKKGVPNLKPPELAELTLRMKYPPNPNTSRINLGGFIVPYIDLRDPVVVSLLAMVNEPNKLTIKNKTPPSDNGHHANKVVRSVGEHDKEMAEKVSLLTDTQIKNICSFFGSFVEELNEVDILPNPSPKNIFDQIVVNFKEGTEWWKKIGKYMPFGRGILVTATDLFFDQFCDYSTHIVNRIYQEALKMRHQGLKSIQLHNDSTGRMYMSLAGGPFVRERESLIKVLSECKTLEQAVEVIQGASEVYSKRRREFAKDILSTWDIQSCEELVNTTYVGVLGNTAYSGAVVQAQGMNTPFYNGIEDVVFRRSDRHVGIFPLGAMKSLGRDQERNLVLPTNPRVRLVYPYSNRTDSKPFDYEPPPTVLKLSTVAICFDNNLLQFI